MKSLPEIQHNQANNLPAHQEQSLEFTKGLLRAVEQGDTLTVVRMEQKVTIETAIHAIHLKTVIRETNEDLVISGLASLILRTSSFFNIGRTMTEDQVIETACLLIEKYPHESLEDFVIMFRNAKLGKYGEMYNRLDGQVIFGWMEKYLDQKAEELEKRHRSQKGQIENINLLEVIANAPEANNPETPLKFRSVADAIKEAIDYDSLEKNENDYKKFRKDFFSKNLKNE